MLRSRFLLRANFALTVATFCCAGFMSGCHLVTNGELTKNYYRIEPGMTEKEVTALLGMPERSVRDTVRWEASQGPDVYKDVVRVEVLFDHDRRVVAKKLTPLRPPKFPPEPPLTLPKFNRDTAKDVGEGLSRKRDSEAPAAAIAHASALFLRR